MKLGRNLATIACTLFATSALATDEARKDLAPSGKMHVGIAVAPTMGAGNVAMGADGQPRGIGAEMAKELAKKLGVPVEWVPYQSSGALTDSAATGGGDIAFLPYDKQRAQKVVFGAPHMVLQSTYLVGPGSPLQSLADVDKPGVRIVGVEGTATTRGAAASLKNVTMTNVKGPEELFDLLKSGKADAFALARESLVGLAPKLPGSRVLPGAYLNSYVAIALPTNKPAGLAYANAFIEEAKASGMVRRALDSLGMQSSTVAGSVVKL